MTDTERFAEICRYVRSAEHCRDSIGTYGERSVHLALKLFFEDEPSNREVRVGKYIADIKNQNGIHEIQTSGFGSMKQKLEDYLSRYDVELIYPVPEKRRIMWLSPDTGEVVREYMSPRPKKPAEIFTEFLYLGDCLLSPRLSFTLVSLATEETALLDGIGAQKRRRATIVDKLPTELLGIRHFDTPSAMAELFPYKDGDTVTGESVRSFLRAKGRSGWAALKVMEKLGILERCGKEGNKLLYKFSVK